jgi:hypothetical protein
VSEGRVWCDKSSLVIRVSLEIGGAIVEDASWLRKENDPAHINLAELDAVVKGINLALKWEVKELEVRTDSATVFGWLKSILTNERRIKTRGLGEALVIRRLSLVKTIVEEYGLKMTVVFVNSSSNIVDRFTRVPRKWIALGRSHSFGAVAANSEYQDEILRIHGLHHLGVNRTWHVVKQCLRECSIKKEDVAEVVGQCLRCREIDPAPIKYEKGVLEVENVWKSEVFTLIDCGPSRFAIWKLIQDEGEQSIVNAVSEIV